jgi:asparagine synthase (glutamine-hydrolysing)
MTSVDLIYNTGFAWYSKGDSHVKGFAHLPDGKYLTGETLLDYFNSSPDLDGFNSRVSEANGMFSVIVSGEGFVRLGVDRMRSFPVFYSLPGKSGLQISDSVDKIISSTGEWKMNVPARDEFLATGYVTGNETLAEGIFQVQAAEIVEIKASDNPQGKRINSSVYSSYRRARTVPERPSVIRSGRLFDASIEELIEEFSRITNRVSERLVSSLGGRTAVIELSGGYDSRLVASMLKKHNYSQLICFSYGREGNPDMIRAEEVAERLGLKFIPIIYTGEMISGFQSDQEFLEYVRFSSNKTSMFFMQEYFAMKYLLDEGLIPSDAVFIPGHSGDFFGGSQLIKHGLHDGDEPVESTISRIFNTKYAWNKPAELVKKSMVDRIGRTLADRDIVTGAIPYTVHEDWDLKEKFAKFIVNSSNIFAWFGFEYRLPLYDYELQDFFRDLPYEYKFGKKLYDKFLTENIFNEFDLNFKNELQPDEKIQRKARLKGKIKSILPGSLIPTTVSRQDPIFYYEITDTLRQDLAGRGIDIRIQGNSYNSLIVQWYIKHLEAESAGS